MVFEGQFSPLGTLALFDAPLMQPQADWPPRTRLCGTPLYDGPAADPALLASLQEFLTAGDAPIVFVLGSSAVWLGGDFWPSAIEAARQLGRRAILVSVV
jgi:rhamnosyltransferase subunit B